MKKLLSVVVFLLASAAALGSMTAGQAEGKIRKEIQSIMDKQAKCWSAGDMDCYMDGYWKSDKLMFIGKSGLVYGWQQTLDRYKRTYPDKAAMGRLDLKLKHIEPLGDAIFVIGTWELKRKKDRLSGYYSLLWKNIGGKWVIVADHSS